MIIANQKNHKSLFYTAMLSKIRPSPPQPTIVGIDLGSRMVVHTALVTVQCALSVSDPQFFCSLKFNYTYIQAKVV